MKSVLIALLAFGLLGSCAGHYKPKTSAPPPYSLQSQYNATVVVEIPTGGFGSGVIISDKYVLTAYHVVDEPAETVYLVHMANGPTRMMVRDKSDAKHDMARLKFLRPLERFEGIKYPSWAALPQVGKRIVLVSGGPTRNVRDGLLEEIDLDKPGHDIRTSTVIEPGNSGSGLYDEQGRLVAIATRYYQCQNTQICGGRGASVIQFERFFLGN